MNEICSTCNGSGGIDTFEESIGEIVTIPCPDCGGRGMNLSKLFEMQRQLDEKILERFPHLRNEDLLPKKILALQVELGELCNCWRGFKFWSEDQVPRTRVLVNRTTDDIGFKYIGPEHIKNPLLEEYVDGLHFLLSIGLEIGCDQNLTIGNVPKRNSLIDMFMDVFKQVAVFDSCLSDLKHLHKDIKNYNAHRVHYSILLDLYLELGQMLGFTWKQIEEAYLRKNAVNHQRQENGY